MARRTQTRRRNGGSGAAKFVLVLFLLALTAAGAGAWLVLTPYGPQTQTFVEILPGSSTVRIGRQLQEAGIVRSQYAFDAMRWFQHETLKAGDYRFDHPASVTEAYDRIRRGDTYTIAVTVTERKSTRLNSSHLGISYAV